RDVAHPNGELFLVEIGALLRIDRASQLVEERIHARAGIAAAVAEVPIRGGSDLFGVELVFVRVASAGDAPEIDAGAGRPSFGFLVVRGGDDVDLADHAERLPAIGDDRLLLLERLTGGSRELQLE